MAKVVPTQQVQGPEFKPQYHKHIHKNKTKQKPNLILDLTVCQVYLSQCSKS
jgi:hypothetical protein